MLALGSLIVMLGQVKEGVGFNTVVDLSLVLDMTAVVIILEVLEVLDAFIIVVIIEDISGNYSCTPSLPYEGPL